MNSIVERTQAFCRRFELRVPILLAPMAGACPASLSIAVANAGGLGACGVLLMQPDEIRIWARDVRAGSNGSFQLNNWIPDPPPARDSVHEARVREFLGHWGPTVAPEAGEAATPDFAAQCEAMLEADPRIISSIMGLYPEEFVAKMKARGIAWWATGPGTERRIRCRHCRYRQPAARKNIRDRTCYERPNRGGGSAARRMRETACQPGR